MPLVSVVMPVFNNERFVAEAIDSILRQTLSDFEFIIVDDGSQDGAAAVIEAYAESDPRIRFLQHTENKGEAAARNTGAARATGKYFTGMDSDDISLPQRLEKQVAYLEAHPEIGAVGISDITCNEELKRLRHRQLPARHSVIALHLLLFTRTVMRSSPMMTRREYLDREPLFDPGIVVGSDLALYLRLLCTKGIRYANVPEELYLYRRHANTMNNRLRAFQRTGPIEIRCQALRKLGERGRNVEWILHKHPLNKLSWRERRRARRDISNFIAAMVEHNWVDAGDEAPLHVEMNQLLESTTPRYWQMFLHWYRYRIARAGSVYFSVESVFVIDWWHETMS